METKESLPQSSEEQLRVYTQAEAEKIWKDQPRVLSKVYKFLGKENTADLIDILNCQLAREINLMQMTGILTPETCSEYILQLPEYHGLRKRLHENINRVNKVISDKIFNHYMRDTGLNARGEKIYPKVVQLFQQSFDEIIKMFHIEGAWYRTTQLNQWYLAISTSLASVFGMAANLPNAPRQVIETTLNEFPDLIKQSLSFLVKDIVICQKVMEEELSQYFKRHPLRSNDVKEDNQLLYEEVFELSCYRKIEPFTAQLEDIEIEFFSENEAKINALTRGHTFTMLAIRSISASALNQINKILPSHSQQEGYDGIYLMCDRSSGELLFPFTTMSLEIAMKDKRIYEQLKYRVFSILLDYLEHKAPDLEDHFIGSSQKAEVNKEIGSTIQQNQTSISAILSNEAEIPLILPEIKKESFEWKKLRGKKSELVKRAVTSLVGSAERIEGSHHVYRGKNGRTYPIPFHANKNVGINILKKFLAALDIPPELLLEKL